MRAEVGLGKSDREGGIRGKIELCVALAPVSRNLASISMIWGDQPAHLMTAMLTGAVVLAR